MIRLLQKTLTVAVASMRSSLNNGEQEQQEEDEESEHSSLLLFGDQTEALDCVQAIVSSSSPSSDSNHTALSRFRVLLDKYLECPTLLDPCLERMVGDLAQAAKTAIAASTHIITPKANAPPPAEPLLHDRLALSALYALSKVRGRKTIQRFLPHAVEDVSIIWSALRTALQHTVVEDTQLQQQQQQPPLWESTYMLLYWMALLAWVPLNIIHDFDYSLLQTMLQDHLVTTAGPTRDAAATCLAAWLVRPDVVVVVASSWPQFAEWAADVVRRRKNERWWGVLGVLQTLATMLPQMTSAGNNNSDARLERRLATLWNLLWQLDHDDDKNILLQRKLIKWWTRMACALLTSPPTTTTTTLIPDWVEDATGRILQALHHSSSTAVRWSAAKGLGRIAERLPAASAQEDVLDGILLPCGGGDDDYYNNNNYSNWHGPCLALAELARRRLIPTATATTTTGRLADDVVPLLLRALADEATTAGRDAACYTYWALCRASYQLPDSLHQAVLLTSLLDREVNCRRAASAAFQEAVGRGLPSQETGIAILQTADYFSLGNRTAAYTSIAWKIADLGYRQVIMEHLYTIKLFHWDIQIRTLSSKSLNGLVTSQQTAEFVCRTVLPYLMERCFDERNLNIRHGAVLGVAELTLALARVNAELTALTATQDSLEKLQTIVSAMEKKRLYRGRGGEIMRSAVCRLVECISLAKIPLTVKQQVQLLDCVDASIPHPSETIQKDACAALQRLLVTYFKVNAETGPSARLQSRVVDKFVQTVLSSDNPAATRGYTAALGYLPAKLLAPSVSVLESVLSCLIRASHYQKARVGGESDAETRRNALVSLIRIAGEVGVSSTQSLTPYPVVSLNSDNVSELFQAFLRALNDYKTDRRGDVGSWCRMASMEALSTLLCTVFDAEATTSTHPNGELVTNIVGALLKQLAEKLDTVRRCAGKALASILWRKPRIPGIAGHYDLLMVLELDYSVESGDGNNSQKWSDPSYAFPKLMEAASIVDQVVEDVYFENVVFGVVLSIGGLTANVSKEASSALLKWTKNGSNAQRLRLSHFLLSLLQRHRGNRRVVLPTLKTIDMLLAHQTFDEGISKSSSSKSSMCAMSCQELLEKEEAVCKDVHRLFAIVDVSVSLLNASPSSQHSLAFLCEMLAHEYPRVRSYVAQQLFLYLSEQQNPADENVPNIVLNTPWTFEPFGDDQKMAINELAGVAGVRDEVHRRLEMRRSGVKLPN